MPQPSRTVTISLRITRQEREALLRMAGSQGLSSLIRERLFDANKTASPLKSEAAARMLAQLGQSGVALSLRQIARAIELGDVTLDDETNQALRRACADIAEIKSLLMRSLRIKEH